MDFTTKYPVPKSSSIRVCRRLVNTSGNHGRNLFQELPDGKQIGCFTECGVGVIGSADDLQNILDLVMAENITYYHIAILF